MNARDDERDRGEGFLGRWIKRKSDARERAAPDDQPSAETSAQGAAKTEDADRPEEPAFDLSSLPGLEDITAETNLADFMRKEVPAALRNAALKRAWALDPAIRDYVNPAREYAYDWNTPGGVPGNGPLEAGFDALKQVAEAFSAPGRDHTLVVSEATQEEAAANMEAAESASEAPSPVRISDMSNSSQDAEKQSKESSDEERSAERVAAPSDLASRRRRHGGAAPA
jgi:hypothetical protein